MSDIAAYGGDGSDDERQMIVVTKLYECRCLLSMISGSAWSVGLSGQLMSGHLQLRECQGEL